jgi:tripartite-type tricarboxylate transporter receptor subunit TctC
MRIRLIYMVALICAASLASGTAHCQPDKYPTKPIRLVVPFSPGGISDILARIVASSVTESLGQPVIVDYRPGAGGNIGTELVARAVPDGYTLLFCSSAVARNPSLYRKLGYDPIKDFSPVAEVASATNLVVVNPSLPARNIKQLIELARAKPGAINYGSGGNGTSGQFAAELFKLSANVNFVHVPYKGAEPSVIGLLSGEVQLMFAPLPLVLPHVNAGKLIPLAVTSLTRSRAIPNLPTIAESGIPGFDVTAWFGVLAPASTPKIVISRLNTGINKALQLPEVQERMAGQGAEPSISTPDDFGKYIRSEVKTWSEVIKRAGIKME